MSRLAPAMPRCGTIRAAAEAGRASAISAVAAMTTYPAGLLVSAGVLIGQSWSLATAVIVAGSVVVGHVAGWWLPYAGVSVGPQRDVYREEYSRTVSVLPRAGHEVVVDVQHMVTGILGLVMLGTSLAALVTR